jgi:hypothetical protein
MSRVCRTPQPQRSPLACSRMVALRRFSCRELQPRLAVPGSAARPSVSVSACAVAVKVKAVGGREAKAQVWNRGAAPGA